MKNKKTTQSKEFRIVIQVFSPATDRDGLSQNNDPAPVNEIVIRIGDEVASSGCKIVITVNKTDVILQKNPADTDISRKSPERIQARTPQVRLPAVRMVHVQAASRRLRTLSARRKHISHPPLRPPRRVIHMCRNRSPVLKPRSDPVSDLFAKQHPNDAGLHKISIILTIYCHYCYRFPIHSSDGWLFYSDLQAARLASCPAR